MAWTNQTPASIGFYWCHQYGKTRMVKVWKYPDKNDSRLFTNEDGACLVTDPENFSGAMWCGPIEPPHPPK